MQPPKHSVQDCTAPVRHVRRRVWGTGTHGSAISSASVLGAVKDKDGRARLMR